MQVQDNYSHMKNSGNLSGMNSISQSCQSVHNRSEDIKQEEDNSFQQLEDERQLKSQQPNLDQRRESMMSQGSSSNSQESLFGNYKFPKIEENKEANKKQQKDKTPVQNNPKPSAFGNFKMPR